MGAILEDLIREQNFIEEETVSLADDSDVTLEEQVEDEDLAIPEQIDDVGYGFEEQFLAQQDYQSSIDYDSLFYVESNVSKYQYEANVEEEREYFAEGVSEILSEEDAEEVFMEIQYANVTGATNDVNVETKRRFAFYALQNPAMFKFIEGTQALTRDYSVTVN